MLSYPAAIPLSHHTLIRLAELIRARRAERRCRWRRLDASRQALLVLAHLRNGDTYARLAAGFAIGTSTAWRYVREAVDLLSMLADDVHAAVLRAYSGRHRRHVDCPDQGGNVLLDLGEFLVLVRDRLLQRRR
ncbi:dienelactone hydrolase [Nonomuraea thailandensis]|uniref:Dienelactone hydrolase n=1 Tax=Nonomuraea thailandensis TaxID=1188745 RepID=A0A9X2K1D4_9ACTN|nr:dienelactone hydrolase [Nonomuraea thailandensis]